MLGEPGIGKTALTAEAVEAATARSLLVLTATGSEFESHLPYAALQQLFGSHRHRLALLRPRQREALEAAFGLGPPGAPDPYLVGLAAVELLSEIGGGRGVLVVVDDAHWVDGSTAQVLAFVARRIQADPVALLVGLRNGYRSPLTDQTLPRLELGPLSDLESGSLVVASRPDLDPAGRTTVLALAQGNPLALLELSSAADENAPGLQRRLADRLQRAFLARVSDLDDEARTALLVAALHDGDLISEILDAADQVVTGPVRLETLERVAGTGAVTIDGPRLRFRHPLVRSAVVGDARASAVRSAHAALARVLPTSSDRAAWHLAASVIGPDAAASAALEAVADRAQRQGNPAVMLRALESAASLSVRDDQRARRLLRAAEAAVELGRLDRANALAERVDRASLSRRDTAQLALLLNSLDPNAHSAARVDQLASYAEEAIEAEDLELALALVLAAGAQLNLASFAFSRHRAIRAARRIADLLGDTDVRSLAVLAAVDPLPYAQRISERVAQLDPAQLGPHAELLVGAAFVVDADPGLARLQTALLDSYRRHGSLRSIARLQAIHSWTEITLANWPEAIQAADEGIRLSREVDDRQRESGAMVGQAMIAAMRGELAESGRLLTESESVAMSRGAQDVLTGIQLTKGLHAIATGHYDGAMSALKRTFDAGDPSYHPLQSSWGLGDLAEAGFHSGRLEEVRTIVAGLGTRPSATPWQSMATAYAAPFLARDAETTEAAYETALVGLVGRWPTYRARMLLEYGQWLRRQNRINEARDRLRSARESADSLSMRPWAERARNELRATGEDSGSFRPKAWARLSPQELQVAQLAGAGLTNREIAERLFLSHRTVGSHLYRIFPKLGVTNRAQLAAVLGAPAAGSAGPSGGYEPTRTSSQLTTESATSRQPRSIVRE